MILFNGSALCGGTLGLARYARAALRALLSGPRADQVEVWLPSALATHEDARDLPRLHVFPAPHPRRGHAFNTYFWAGCLALHRLARAPRSHVFSPVEVYSPIPLGRPLLTVHDCFAERFGDPARGGRLGLGRKLCVRQMRRSRLLAVSRFTAEELAALHGLRAPRVIPTPNWLAHDFDRHPSAEKLARVRATLRLPPRFWLYVGGFRLNKNLPLLFQAYARALAADPSLPPLVLAGKWPPSDTPYTGPLNAALAASGLPPERLPRPGFVADEDLPALYHLAELVVCPSRYEGFGYPVIEAAACGAPVLAARAASFPEIWPHEHALFPPDDPAALAALLARAAREPAAFRHPLPADYEPAAGEARLRAAIEHWLTHDASGQHPAR